MTHRDPTIIALCHPRDVHWMNAALSARTPEDVERAEKLHEIARALGNLANMPPVSDVSSLFDGAGEAFARVNREPSLDDVSKSTALASSIVQPEPQPRARTRSL